MRRSLGALIVAVLCGVSGVADRLAAQQHVHVRRTVAALADRVVDVRVATGAVLVRAETRPDIAIEVAGDGDVRRSTAPPVRIDTDADDVVLVRVDDPAGSEGAERQIHVLLRVPLVTPLRLDVGVGRIDIEGTRGAVQAHVERGPLVARNAGGILRLETGTGDVLVEQPWLPADGLLRLRTLRGDISVSLEAPPADARVILLALRGQVETDLPLSVRGRVHEGVFGAGRALLTADAAQGTIRVRVPGQSPKDLPISDPKRP